MNYTIPIIVGTTSDLTAFNFSFAGITILNTKSKEFDLYISNLLNSIPEIERLYYKSLISLSIQGDETSYAIVKKEPVKGYSSKELYRVFELLLIVFPSDLQIVNEIVFQCDEYWHYVCTYKQRYKFQENDKPMLLIYRDAEISVLNEYFKLVFSRMESHSYLKLAIYHYVTSYKANYIHLAYSSLYIALEATVKGGDELKYRLGRNTAILCGDSVIECRIINQNVRTFGQKRNEIMHGHVGKRLNGPEITACLKALRKLVAKVILELLIHDIDTVDILDQKLTEIGYGQRNKISKNWKKIEINYSTFYEVGLLLKK